MFVLFLVNSVKAMIVPKNGSYFNCLVDYFGINKIILLKRQMFYYNMYFCCVTLCKVVNAV